MKKLFIISALGLMSLHTSAQISIAPEVGFQFSNAAYNSDSVTTSTDAKTSYRAGINLGFGIAKNFNIHAGAFLSVKGAKSEDLGFKASTNLNYIEVPVYLNYIIGDQSANYFFVGVGPYFSYCASGKYKIEGSLLGVSINEEDKLNVGNDEFKDDVKPIDMGANANIGFVTQFGLYARAHYALGLTNTIPGGSSSNSAKNRTYGISVGYMIKL